MKQSMALDTGAANNLTMAIQVVREWYHLEDEFVVEAILAAVKANQADGVPLWLLVVGAPSTGKTSFLEAFRDLPGTYFLSSITHKTLVSGLSEENRPKDAPPLSLIQRLKPNTILVIKDLSGILSIRTDRRQEIFAQLREIYDGHYDKDFGTGKGVHWVGKLGIIAATTKDIDRDTSLLSGLGERFLYARPNRSDDTEMALRAMSGASNSDEATNEISKAFQRVLEQAGDPMEVTYADAALEIAAMAEATAAWRASVPRDRDRTVPYRPEPEGSPRLATQLLQLGRGFAAINNRTTIGKPELRFLLRIAHDSIPSLRADILAAFVAKGGGASVPELAETMRLPETTLREKVHDLEILGLVDADKRSKKYLWRLLGDPGGPFQSKRWLENTDSRTFTP